MCLPSNCTTDISADDKKKKILEIASLFFRFQFAQKLTGLPFLVIQASIFIIFSFFAYGYIKYVC